MAAWRYHCSAEDSSRKTSAASPSGREKSTTSTEPSATAVGGAPRDDLLHMLLEARDEESGQGMTDRQLRDELVTLFLAGPTQVTLPRQMFTGIRENITPTIAAVATLLIVFTTALMLARRGKAQFGLIVTGYSLVASSGSGFPDNGFEIDGAEKADSQPVTASVLYNMTYIGVPESIAANSADHATEWRDNANVQFRNCIFMDTGEDVVKGANGASDGEGSNGYGFNGTLNWDVRWTTAFSHNHNAANPNAGGFLTAQLQALYPAQVDGNLIEIKDSVFFNNTDSTAYTEANTRQVFAAQNNNVQEPATSPIVAIARTSTAPFGATNGQGRTVHNVTNLDPRAAGDAITSVATAPNDGFFTQAKYRGAFSKDVNWLLGWTASHAFGFHAGQTNPADPAVTLKVHLTTVSFLAANGVSYSIEKSTNGLTWTPVSGLVGDGTTKTISDVLGASFEATVLYRVIMN